MRQRERMADDGKVKRGPGRPRKWANDAERMRAYRATVAHERNVIKAGGTYAEMAQEIASLTGLGWGFRTVGL